jgi:molybdopterin-guanine dinucleotide biosynthesis protein A
MRAPKAFALVGGVQMIKRALMALGPLFSETLIVANDPALYSGLGVRVVSDIERFRHMKGPMTGIYSGLQQARYDTVFAAGCDMPFIEPRLVVWMAGQLEGHDAVVPRVGGKAEPLLGFYRKTAARALEEALLKGERSLQAVLGWLDVRYAEEVEMREFDPQLCSLVNVNTPDDLERAVRCFTPGGG